MDGGPMASHSGPLPAGGDWAGPRATPVHRPAHDVVGVSHDAEQSPRARVRTLLHDPKAYFADAREWAGTKAKADVQRRLSERRARRMRRATLLQRLGFPGR